MASSSDTEPPVFLYGRPWPFCCVAAMSVSLVRDFLCGDGGGVKNDYWFARFNGLIVMTPAISSADAQFCQSGKVQVFTTKGKLIEVGQERG